MLIKEVANFKYVETVSESMILFMERSNQLSTHDEMAIL